MRWIRLDDIPDADWREMLRTAQHSCPDASMEEVARVGRIALTMTAVFNDWAMREARQKRAASRASLPWWRRWLDD